MKDKKTEKEILSMDAFVSLMQSADHISAFVHAHLKDIGLTVSQFGVLEALYFRGSMCQKAIAEIIRKTTGNMTTVIDNLEKSGLAVREKDPDDRRYFTVSITEKGKTLLERSFNVYKDNVILVMEPLNNEELETLKSLTKKLVKT